jgi:hypothetical protein
MKRGATLTMQSRTSLRSKREERVPSQPRRTRSLGGKRRIGAFGLFPESSIQDLESGSNRKLVLLVI